MRVTKFADFGLRALFFLAGRGSEIHSAAVIADRLGVSRHHMAKVLHALAIAGYVDGIRGAHGGVRLARDPRDIFIGEVVRALDARQLQECFGEEKSGCTLLPHCRLKTMFAAAQLGFLRELDRYTLSDSLADSMRGVDHFTTERPVKSN